MLQLNKRTEYGLIALTHLAGREGQVTSVREMAERYTIPRRLLAEVLKELCRTGQVISQRGASGGYSLAKPAHKITLGEVVAVLEGQPSIASCESLGAFRKLGRHTDHQSDQHVGCDVEPHCPIRSPMQRIRSSIWSMMQRTSLRDLADPTFGLSFNLDSEVLPRVPFSA